MREPMEIIADIGVKEIKRLTEQLSATQAELQQTQLHLMAEETDRKIWEQDCKKAEAELEEAKADTDRLQDMYVDADLKAMLLQKERDELREERHNLIMANGEIATLYGELSTECERLKEELRIETNNVSYSVAELIKANAIITDDRQVIERLESELAALRRGMEKSMDYIANGGHIVQAMAVMREALGMGDK